MRKSVLLFLGSLLILSCATRPPHNADAYRELAVRYPGSDFERVDRAVLNLEKEEEATIDSLVQSLDGIAFTEWEKVRSVYIWITHNISYDTKGFFGKREVIADAEESFQAREGVCAGYSRLFTVLADKLGLEVREINGYGKGYGYQTGTSPQGINHAWNAVRIDGIWHLFESTWGAGGLKGKQFVWRYEEFFFDPDPVKFIFTHFPENPEDQFLEDPIDRDMFFNLPRFSSLAFDYGIVWGRVLEQVLAGETITAPVFYISKNPPTRMDIPITDTLSSAEVYHLEIEAPAVHLLYRNNEDSKVLSKTDGRFVLEQKFQPGTLVLFLSLKGEPDSYSGILRYDVK